MIRLIRDVVNNLEFVFLYLSVNSRGRPIVGQNILWGKRKEKGFVEVCLHSVLVKASSILLRVLCSVLFSTIL